MTYDAVRRPTDVFRAGASYREGVSTPAGLERPRDSVTEAILVALTALFVTAFLIGVTGHISAGKGTRGLDGIGVLILVAAGLAVGLSRRWPATSVGIVTVALSAYLVRDYPGGPVWVTGWAALGSLSWRRSRTAGFVGAAFFCGVLLTVAAIDDRLAPLLHLVFVGWSIAAVLVGDALRTRRERMRELEERARELEHTRDEETRRRIAEERLRIARDLHDSVAHAMATINVQAGAAAHVLDRRPEAAKGALIAIQRASGDVLEEMTALIGLLRNAGEDPGHSPTPGLDRIADLVDSSRASGLEVSLSVRGPVDRVAAPIGTAAYRIVQESLTNVIRHAAGAAATVTVEASDDGGVAVEVIDDGGIGAGAGAAAARSSSGSGMGIRGMRERAAATGGSLVVGPRPQGGFVVHSSWGDHG